MLNREDVGQLPLIGFRPDVIAIVAVDQLSGHFQAIPGFPNASFEEVFHSQFVGNRPHVSFFCFEGE